MMGIAGMEIDNCCTSIGGSNCGTDNLLRRTGRRRDIDGVWIPYFTRQVMTILSGTADRSSRQGASQPA